MCGEAPEKSPAGSVSWRLEASSTVKVTLHPLPTTHCSFLVTREELVNQVSGLLHSEQMIEAAKLIASFSGLPTKPAEDRTTALELCNSLLYWCLGNDKYEWAARMLWSEQIFNSDPRATQMIWEEIKATNSLMLMGAASMSKSYGAGAWLLLDWVRDPEYTSVNLVGPSEDHLRDNLFTHLVTMHSQASLPLPGQVGDLFIGLDPRKRKGAIRGIVIPIGKKPAGRLQGRKRVPRKIPHPQLGKMSRIRFLLDETEKIPIGVWKDVDNVFANLDADVDGFKIICAFNPEDPEGQVAVRCEPEKGWEDFDAETDEKWTSKRGWRVLRLDAAKSENVISGKVIYPGLQTKEGFDRIVQNSGGTDSPGYWTMARACFPRGGAVYSVISSSLVHKMRGELIFAEAPIACGAVDLALEGNDAAEMSVGRFGKAMGIRYPPSFEYPGGREIHFTDLRGRKKFRWGLQVDQIFQLPKADTVKMAERIRLECMRFHISPSWLMLDRTGNGAGVHDLLKSLWSAEVRGVNYTQAATDKKILVEDTKTASEEYERAVSELWFALKKWAEFDFVKIGPSAQSEELSKQLSGRRYKSGKLTQVEGKPEYKSRGNGSPNKADTLTLILHGVRAASGVIPSALDDMAGNQVTGAVTFKGPVPVFVGVTDELDTLEGDDDTQGWVD